MKLMFLSFRYELPKRALLSFKTEVFLCNDRILKLDFQITKTHQIFIQVAEFLNCKHIPPFIANSGESTTPKPSLLRREHVTESHS